MVIFYILGYLIGTKYPPNNYMFKIKKETLEQGVKYAQS